MTDATGRPAEAPTPLETALLTLDPENAEEQVAVLQTLAVSDLVLPQVGENDGAITLPVVDQEGTSFVPVFTTEDRMNDVAPQLQDFATVTGAALGAAWPEGSDLWLAVNPGSEPGVTVPPDAVRALAGLAG